MKEKNDLIRLWITKAENDLITAEHSLNIKPKPPVDIICFHAQQCAEKYLKAYLTYQDIEFEKTHDIGELVYLCSSKNLEFESIYDMVKELTPFAVEIRYPGIYDDITLQDAVEAVEIARKTKDFVLKKLPKEVIESD